MRASRLLGAVRGTRSGHREVTTIQSGGRKEGPVNRRTAHTPRSHAAHTGATKAHCVTRCLRPQTSNVLLQSTTTGPLYTVGTAPNAVNALTWPRPRPRRRRRAQRLAVAARPALSAGLGHHEAQGHGGDPP